MKVAILNPDKSFREWRDMEYIPAHKQEFIYEQTLANIPEYNNIYQYLEEDSPILDHENHVAIKSWKILSKTSEQMKKIWTPLEFWNRFTENERSLLFSLSKTNEGLRLWITLLGMAAQIENDHPMTIQAIEELVSNRLISNDRKNEILYY